MPRYFFDVHDNRDLPDAEDFELPDKRAARDQAIEMAGEILKDEDGNLPGEGWSVTVADQDHNPVFTLRFSVKEH